mmetsp:Transcript_20884/g.32210  ORF Transcript_20884/g.32210 Transcript_20884/m.32210 type:complete len:101 (-) Transcript_20884:1110-1412(-)
MDGSCRQNYFGPVVLWWVWDCSFSLALFQVARFSVSDDAAVAHFSTVELAFRELSAKCNRHSLGSAQEYNSVSCCQSVFSCAVVEVTHPPWKILMFLSGG